MKTDLYTAGQDETDDVVAAISWLKDKGVKSSNIGLYGSSLGGLVALMTPAKSDDFGSIAVIDPPVDFKTLVRRNGLSRSSNFFVGTYSSLCRNI